MFFEFPQKRYTYMLKKSVNIDLPLAVSRYEAWSTKFSCEFKGANIKPVDGSGI